MSAEDLISVGVIRSTRICFGESSGYGRVQRTNKSTLPPALSWPEATVDNVVARCDESVHDDSKMIPLAI
jgi:hypothetical protein